MTQPDHWDVGIVWLTRRLQRPDRMLRTRFGAARRRSDSQTADNARGGLDLLDGCTSVVPADVGVVTAVLFAVALLILFIAIGPGLLAITIGVIEVVLVILGGIIAGALRVLFRQPWEIVARRDDVQLEWRVAGVRRAREVAARVSEQLRQGHDPESIEPSHRDREPPALSGIPTMYRRNEFRLVGRIYGALLALAGIGAVVLLVVR